MKYEPGTAKPEVFCGHHKILEVWDREVKLVEELYSESLEERAGHVSENGFRETTHTHEVKRAEVRMCDVCDDRGMQQLPLDVTTGNSGAKANLEFVQLG